MRTSLVDVSQIILFSSVATKIELRDFNWIQRFKIIGFRDLKLDSCPETAAQLEQCFHSQMTEQLSLRERI
jgi:hypothetical protein